MSGNENEPVLNSTILALVERLTVALPELDGRCIAVSEMEVNRSNVPTLPIGMVALVDVTARQDEKTNRTPNIVEQIVAEFWFKSNKIKTDKNTETPFWAYYDYDPLLHKVVSAIFDWTTPKGYKLKFTRMDLESDEMAVHITFEFFHDYRFCLFTDDEGEELQIVPHIHPKMGCEDQQIKV